MSKSIDTYILNCLTCCWTKPINTKPQGLLNPLQPPKAPWSSLSVDFITDLPLSKGFDCIMVVVD